MFEHIYQYYLNVAAAINAVMASQDEDILVIEDAICAYRDAERHFSYAIEEHDAAVAWKHAKLQCPALTFSLSEVMP